MFDWFSNTSTQGTAGLARMRAEFEDMLDAGRSAFDMAASVFFGEADADAIRETLFATDKKINRAERQLRKELVVHATVHGATEFPACLVLMSLVKDAERVGDYAKNLFDVAINAPEKPAGKHRETLCDLKQRIDAVTIACREAFDANDKVRAEEIIVQAKAIEDACDENVLGLVRGDGSDAMSASYVLVYRYLKRVCAHIRNVTSSIVQPLHKLDFTSKITGHSEATE